jgi:hypothetical protein
MLPIVAVRPGGKCRGASRSRPRSSHRCAGPLPASAAAASSSSPLLTKNEGLGPDYHDGEWLSCWENVTPPHPDTGAHSWAVQDSSDSTRTEG